MKWSDYAVLHLITIVEYRKLFIKCTITYSDKIKSRQTRSMLSRT